MGCIDRELSLEDVEDRIARFILKDLDEQDLHKFIEHMVDCKYCDTMAMSGLKAKRVFQQQIVYEKLCAAHDNGDLEGVIRLGEEMEALGYDEEVHPIKDKVTKANDELIERQVFHYIDKGQGFEKENSHRKALENYKKALELSPDNWGILMFVGKAYRNLKDLDEAERCLLKAESLKPDSPIILFDLGNILIDKGKYIEAEEKLLKAHQLEPDNPDTIHNLGVAFLKNGKVAEAEIMLERANQMMPDHPIVLSVLGSIYSESERFDEAEAALTKANSLWPEDVGILNNLACLYIDKHDIKSAIKAFEKLQAIEPNISATNNNLAASYYFDGRKDEAIHFIKIARKLAPNNQEVLNNYETIMGIRKGQVLLMRLLH